MNFFVCFNLELNSYSEHVFFCYFFSQKTPLFQKTTQKFIDNRKTLVFKELL